MSVYARIGAEVELDQRKLWKNRSNSGRFEFACATRSIKEVCEKQNKQSNLRIRPLTTLPEHAHEVIRVYEASGTKWKPVGFNAGDRKSEQRRPNIM